MDKNKIEALFVTNPVNIFYLTGFKGLSPTEREALLIAGKQKSTLITANLYKHEASKLASDSLTVKIAAERNEYENYIKESFKKVSTFGFEASNLTYAEYKKFKKFTDGKFLPTKNLIEKLRVLKTKEEINKIQKAQLITQKAFEQILKTLKIGQTEIEISDKLTQIIKSLGSNSLAFESIIASGPNSALPHYKTSNRKIKKGDTLLFDFGAKYQDYCADFSRTVFIHKASQLQKIAYNHVKKVQELALSKLRVGLSAKVAHNAAFDYFKKLQLETYFTHSLGHGIGLEVHESPSLSAKSKDILQENMIFSIEPGLYFPWGGIRVEDLVVLKKEKASVIGKPSQFIEIG